MGLSLQHGGFVPLPQYMGLGGGEVLGVIFAGYVLQASQNPYPIIVYSVAKYRPHLGHLLENVIFTIST